MFSYGITLRAGVFSTSDSILRKLMDSNISCERDLIVRLNGVTLEDVV